MATPLKSIIRRPARMAALAIAGAVVLAGCTQETQNKFGRAVQNWTGTEGVLEVYAGDKLIKRFMNIDKLSTAIATGDSSPRPYRFGYGNMDIDLDGAIGDGPEKAKVYFEFSDYSTSYIFYEDPR